MKSHLTGNRVHLRPLRETDMRRRSDWTSDDELVTLMGADPAEEPFVSFEDESAENIKWLHQRQQVGDVLYAIEVDQQYIGDIDVVRFANEHRAELSVFIGDRGAWSKGHGTESVRLVLDELAQRDDVDYVDVDVPGGNDRGLRFWRKLGFQLNRIDEDGLRWFRLIIKRGKVPQRTAVE